MTQESSVEHRARALGDRSAAFFARFGLTRLAAGVLLIVLGVLVLVMPQLITWVVGIGALVFGVLVLATGPAAER